MLHRTRLTKGKCFVLVLIMLFSSYHLLGCSSGDGGAIVVDSGGGPEELPPVDAGANVSASPGEAVNLQVTINDGSTLQSVLWEQSNSVNVTIDGADTLTPTVTLPDLAAYKAELIHVLMEPPISAAELPPNVPVPPGEFPAGLQDRFQVVGLNPFALEEAALVTMKATVTTSSGTYEEEVEIHASLPWVVSRGIADVPLGVPVLLNGKAHMDADGDGFNDVTGLSTTYDWTLVDVPVNSTAALVDGISQNPYFTPDVAGKYTLTVTDTTQAPGTDVITMEIFAGPWVGAISGQDVEGRPLAAGCTVCHDGSAAPDQFTPWMQTGHAEIFTNSLNTNTHYGENCFPCHTVGFDTAVNNGGMDDAPDYAAFFDSGLINNPGDNWTTTLANFPDTAQLANIQCENCHGPNGGSVHPQFGGADARHSISSDVCASCHGEPLRHARFQQWQLSAHANYEVAIDEGDSGNCSRCHTGNGFLTWLPVLLGDVAGDPLDNITVTWTSDEVHPQTCASCHDPHSIGTTSGSDPNATVRISGDTPPLIAGFTATDVGKAAVCMTCHNSRRGLRNDSTFADIKADGDIARAPHGSAQGDMLMGQNAYLVPVGTRGNHAVNSQVEDTCVNCHMEKTAPPDLLAYNQGGTNHTFFASEDICASCHDQSITAAAVQGFISQGLEDLQNLIEAALLQVITDQIALGRTIDMDGDLVADITNAANIKEIVFGEFRGRQAINVIFTDDTETGLTRVVDIDVLDGTPAIVGVLYDFVADDLAKAGWNWNLVNNDGSKGIHNNTFAKQVLEASVAAVTPLVP